MSFPKWAPATLIQEYERLQAEADHYRKKASGEDNFPFSFDETYQEDQPKYKEKVAELEEVLRVLHRLLTYPDMKSVWFALSRPAADPKPWKEPAFLLWTWVMRALTDFPALLVNAKTPAVTKRNLLSVAARAKALQGAIAANAVATVHANKLIAVHLTNRNLEDRQDDGETPLAYEFQTLVTLSSDCSDATRDKEVREYYRSGYNWQDMPLICRLTYWANEAKTTKLDDLLQLFIDLLEREAQRPPAIKQPGRTVNAIKPFLIRRISSYLLYYYGQPLDDIAAQIVSVVLNLETSLTRDDIRPYVFPTGKKKA
jgi:hypothetical protein